MENADEVASQIVKAIVDQSKTIGDFAMQLGKLVIYLDYYKSFYNLNWEFCPKIKKLIY
jgi:hypothetical protein